MNSKVIHIRRDVLPEHIFAMIEDFMHGKLTGIHIIGVTDDGRVVSTSAGTVPGLITRHDTLKKHA